MAAGLRTVKIRFTGDSKGLDHTTKSAERTLKKFGTAVTKSAVDFGSKLQGAISSAVDSLPPQGKVLAVALGAGLVAALAPILGAAIVSAVLLGIGGGVLAGGIAAVAKTPKVKAAFGKLRDSLFDKDTSDIEKKIQSAQERFEKARALGSAKGMQSARYDIDKAKKELEEALTFNKMNKSFKDMFDPFVQPLVRAAKTFTESFDRAKPSIERMAKVLAPVIDKLAPKLGEFFEKVMPGIEKAVAASTPLFNTLAEKLPQIGVAINYFFEKIAGEGDNANDFWGDFLDLVTGLIVTLGDVIAKLASWYDDLKRKIQMAKDIFTIFKAYVVNQFGTILDAAANALSWVPGLGPKLKAAQDKFRDFRVQANKELASIHDRQVRINVWSNIGSVVANIGRQLANLPSGGSVGRRASGGPVSPGRSYLVGERGPELLTMGSSAGHVTPNRDIGGGDTYIYIGNEAIDPHLVRVVRGHDRDTKRRAGMRGATA